LRDLPAALLSLASLAAVTLAFARRTQDRGQSEKLETALLASLSHDLRTPLTAIGVAGNLKASWLTAEDRAEQNDLILSEVERRTRLFHNVLEMARIDAGAIVKEPK
jgi:two-component system sensor histidine kinase KdpD